MFLWSIGGHEVYDYETNFGERFGQTTTELKNPAHIRKSTNLAQLIATAGGPMTIITELCHEVGMKFFPSVRMNEHYNMETSEPGYGIFRRENPEFLIGRPDEVIPSGTIDSGIKTGINYAY